MTLFTALAQLSDDSLHGEVKRLVGRANTLTAELLAHLGEVEARGIHRERACSSLYTYCVYELCMSEDEAQRRCRAARLSRQFPVLLEMLAEASIHLTGILLIAPHLTADNQHELLPRVRYRTKREIERIVGELAPASDLPTRIEVLHGEQPAYLEELEPPTAPARRRATWAAYVRALAGAVRERSAGLAADQAPPKAAPESCVDVTARPPVSADGAHAAPREPPAQLASGAVAGRGARYRVQFTADQDYLDLLETAKELLQHVVPDRDLVEVQRRALQALVKTLQARKLGSTPGTRTRAPERHPPSTRKPAPARSRHVPAEVRRTVWQRDAGCCAYTDSRGQRCRERSGLEFHHRWPHACCGPASVNNLELRCRAHNTLAAEHDFGREWIRARQKQRPMSG